MSIHPDRPAGAWFSIVVYGGTEQERAQLLEEVIAQHPGARVRRHGSREHPSAWVEPVKEGCPIREADRQLTIHPRS